MQQRRHCCAAAAAAAAAIINFIKVINLLPDRERESEGEREVEGAAA